MTSPLSFGMQEHFDWSQVGVAAIAGGVSAGMGGADGNGAGIFRGKEIGYVVLRAAVSNALTQGISMAVGLQKQFNWQGVIASGIAAGAGKVFGETTRATLAGKDGISPGAEKFSRAISAFAAGCP